MFSLQSLSHSALQQKQHKLLKKQLEHCAKNIPYYKALFASLGVDSSKLDALEQSQAVLETLPILDKSPIRNNPDAFRDQSLAEGHVYKSFSSGSTGEPFASYFDRFTWFRKKYFVKLRARFACGMQFGQRVAILECEDAETIAERNRKAKKTDLILKVRVFSLFQDSSALLDQLRAFEPQNIYAYPSHLFELSTELAKTNTPLKSAKRLFTSSEFLESGMREFIEAKFGAHVYDHYGSTEFKEIAWQCKHRDWYHINSDEVICEVLNASGEAVYNQPGEIVVTDLRNRAMPLLRFRLGDQCIKSKEACACGYAGDSIKPLGGRASDYLVFQGDVQLSPFRFTTEIEYLPGVLQYQIEQLSTDLIKVKLRVSSGDGGQEIEGSVTDILRSTIAEATSAELANAVGIDVVYCDRIENESNGKFKVVKRSF